MLGSPIAPRRQEARVSHSVSDSDSVCVDKDRALASPHWVAGATSSPSVVRPMPLMAFSVHFLMFSAVWRSFSHATKPISAFSMIQVFFAGSDSEESEESEEEAAVAEYDEFEAYLALPQIKYRTERGATDWWLENTSKNFPKLAVMARQYLGCPASSAAVERLFSQVGIAFAANGSARDQRQVP